MAIQPINSVKFCGNTQENSNKNSHIKRNAGKYTGMGIGAAAGTAYGINHIKNIPVSLKRIFIQGVEIGMQSFAHKTNTNEILNELEVSRKEFRQDRMRMFKSSLKKIPVIFAGMAILVGLGLGAIADGIINHTRAKKADNTEKTEA